MKYSDLSVREFVALEALNGAAASNVPVDTLILRAFDIADEFLKEAGKRNPTMLRELAR
jgi:hypothetical protein